MAILENRMFKGGIHLNRPMFGAFLETHVKQETIDAVMTSTFPGWSYDSNHSSEAENGRIVLIWNPILSVVVYLKTPQIMVCGIFDPSSGESVIVGFVYAYNERSHRVPLWNSICQLSAMPLIKNSPWIVLGDFNQVLDTSEVYSLYPLPIDVGGITDFQDCLQESEIFDLSFRGCPLTWSNKSPSNPKSRKLDRALVNEAWIDKFPNSLALFDPPGSSDHSSCLVTISNEVARRNTRFTFFPFFTTHPDYARLLENAWNSPIIPSSPMISLYQRLRAAKSCCKGINRTRFSGMEKRTKEAFEKLQSIQIQMLSSPSSLLFQEERHARDLWLILSTAEQKFFQMKSRVRWISKGDMNIGFFHKSVKSNLSRNSIHFLTDSDNRRVFENQEIKNLAIHFYSYLQGRSNQAVTPYSGTYIRSLHPYRFDRTKEETMVAIPTDEEIKSVVFSLPNCKAPGPDGFSAEFFTSSWDLVGKDLTAAVKDFFHTSSLPRQTNTTVLSLIPKISGVSSLTDFRPVSLCNTVYKVISKILASRLKLITEFVVQRNQAGFVKGRELSDNVLLASELVADFNKNGRISRGCLQVDITKAFDSIEWEFIINILSAFELPPLFIQWIKTCITTPYYSVAINGELAGFFPGQKGLRQGDPISSSLFVLAMDILSKELDKATLEGRIGAHPACNDLVSHLSFADDVLIFFDGLAPSMRGILDVLKEFQRNSGLALNLRKTSVFIDGNNRATASALAAEFCISQGSLPVKHLGLPLSPSRLKRCDYQPLIDKIKSRVSSWTARHLSFAGRLELIQSVLYNIIRFWASVFPLSKGCLHLREQILNAFLWSGGYTSARGAKVSWATVCISKKSGGLRLKRLMGLNNVYGVKLLWKLFAGTDSLWVAWVKRNYIQDRIFWVSDFSNMGSWIWRSLMNLRSIARPFILCHVNSGKTASLWFDNWTHRGALIEVTGLNGPMVSGIPAEASVFTAVMMGGWSSSRSRSPTLLSLRASLPSQPPDINSPEEDYFLWRNSVNDPPSMFSASKLWHSLHPDPALVPWYKAVWFKKRIPKHAFITWLLVWDRMKTRDKLIAWGINVPASCLLCGHMNELTTHLFFECDYSNDVWNRLFARSRIQYPDTSMEEIVPWITTGPAEGKFREVIKIIFQAAIYYIWKERNSRLHSNISRPTSILVKDIFLQLRTKLYSLDREDQLCRTPSHQFAETISYLSVWFDRFQDKGIKLQEALLQHILHIASQ